MTKRHFIALADALSGLTLSSETLEALCTWCREMNPQFDRQRWEDYRAGLCGPSGGKVKASRTSAAAPLSRAIREQEHGKLFG